MKKLLLTTLTLGLSACATAGPRAANTNSAPAILAPPDFNAGAPVTNEAYLNAQADYHFTLGETYGFEGQSARAVEEYKTTLIYDPKSVHVRLRLAAEYVRLGMTTEAIEQGEIATESDPKSVEAHMLLGGIYAGLKLFAPARDQFRAVLDLEPGQAEASIYLGALLAEERKYDEAIGYFKALTTNAKFEEPERAWFYIGRVRAEQGEPHLQEAKHALTKALALKPEFPEAAIALAGLHKTQGQPAESAAVLENYQDKFGPTREMSAILSQYYIETSQYDRALTQLENVDGFERDNLNVKIQIALILIERKRYDQATQRLEDILAVAPDSDKVRYYLAAVYEEVGKTDLAVQNYRRLRPESTYYAEGIVRAAHLLQVAGKLDAALALASDAVKAAPDQPAIYAFYATLLDEKKDYAGGVRLLTGAVEKFPDNTQLRFFLGTMQDHVGDVGASIQQMLKVIAQDHDFVQALNYLAFTYAERGIKLGEARDYADRALALEPKDPYILDTVGWVRFKQGDVESAVRYLEAAAQAKPTESIINEHLGDAYLRNQMWQKAEAHYRKALALEPDPARHRVLNEKISNIHAQATRLPAEER